MGITTNLTNPLHDVGNLDDDKRHGKRKKTVQNIFQLKSDFPCLELLATQSNFSSEEILFRFSGQTPFFRDPKSMPTRVCSGRFKILGVRGSNSIIIMYFRKAKDPRIRS